MAKEIVYHIGPVDGKKVKCEINWIDKEARIHVECEHKIRDKSGHWCDTCQCHVDDEHIATGHFGVSYIDKYPHDEGGQVLLFQDKDKTWSFKR